MSELNEHGGLIRAADLTYQEIDGCQVATAVGPELGARQVRLDVVRIPAGTAFTPGYAEEEENVVLVFSGTGKGAVADTTAEVGPASALHAPTGRSFRLEATEDLVGYVWRTRLSGTERRGTDPKTIGSLWDDEVQLRGFTGTGEVPTDAGAKLATMNFVFWPGSGSARMCLHCGIQQPGEMFAVHTHPHSEEAFISFEGEGQMYHLDRWHDVSPGDVLYAPPGVPHGTRNPNTGPDAVRFVTCGGPTPSDANLYQRAGLSPEVR